MWTFTISEKWLYRMHQQRNSFEKTTRFLIGWYSFRWASNWKPTSNKPTKTHTFFFKLKKITKEISISVQNVISFVMMDLNSKECDSTLWPTILKCLLFIAVFAFLRSTGSKTNITKVIDYRYPISAGDHKIWVMLV